jgi:cobalt-zinc-cadmium efflux system outer membrane protein|tara:strand:- start:4042 stop:5268 length:1227 start_codon:yes stop_codon:yes gene_type:complete
MSKFILYSLLLFSIQVQLLLGEQALPIVTLDNVSHFVRKQNPDLAAARMLIKEASGRLAQSGRLSNPELQSSIEHNSRLREGRIEIGISQKFPITNRLQLEKDVSLSELEAAKAEVRETERKLIGRSRELVVNLQASRERRKLLSELIGVSTEFAEFLNKAAEKGEGSTLDAGQAKLETAILSVEIPQLQAREAALMGELKPLLGMRISDPMYVGGDLGDPTLPTKDLKPAMRPDLKAATLTSQAASQQVELEKARRYADVEGGLFFAGERAEDAPGGYEDEAIIGFQFKIALPLWDKNEGAIQEAKARKKRKDLEVDALRRNINLAAQSTRDEMTKWKRLIEEIDETLLPLAEQQTKFAEEAYRNGQGEIQSVLRTREKRLQLAASKLDALKEFHLARVRHKTALGR